MCRCYEGMVRCCWGVLQLPSDAGAWEAVLRQPARWSQLANSRTRMLSLTNACFIVPILQACLDHWLAVLNRLTPSHMPERTRDAASCIAAWRAAEALLRLLPSLPRQPVPWRDGWCTAAAVAAERGGVDAYFTDDLAGSSIDVVPLMAPSAVHAAARLLHITPPASQTTPPAAVAQAALEALSTACRLVHRLAPALQLGSSSTGGIAESGLLTAADSPLLMRALDAAAFAALRACRAWVASLPTEEEQAAVDRCAAACRVTCASVAGCEEARWRPCCSERSEPFPR